MFSHNHLRRRRIATATAALLVAAFAGLHAIPASADTNESTGGWNLDAANRLSVGPAHACAILNNGSLKCWGSNTKGQLGIDSTTNVGDPAGSAMPPVAVNLGTGKTAMAVAVGDSHSCVILSSSQKVKCWGDNADGQLGYKLDNLAASAKTAIGDDAGEMASLDTVNLGDHFAKSIAAAGNTTCVILDNDQVKCWGKNSSGQLGQNSSDAIFSKNLDPADYPTVDLNGPSYGVKYTAKSVAVGSTNVCVIIAENLQPKCWGTGSMGANGLGDEVPIGDSGVKEPGNTSPIAMGSPVRALAISTASVCAIIGDGDVKCWGSTMSAGQDITFAGPNGFGIGDGNGTSVAATPVVNLGNGRKAVAITSGSERMCATLDDGSAKCWGANGQGRNGYGSAVTTTFIGGGIGSFTPMTDLPFLDFGGAKVQYVSSGGLSNCAVMYDATVRCWGATGRVLGYDSNDAIGTPTGPALSTAKAVNLGDYVGTASTTSTTSTTTTTVAPTTTKAAGSNFSLKPVPLEDRSLPNLSLGASAFTVGGKNSTIIITSSGGRITARAGTFSVSVSGAGGGNPVALTSGSGQTLPAGSILSVSGEGFKSGTTATLWIVKGNTLLGSAKVSSSGTVSISGTLASSLTSGTYTIQVAGTGKDGKVRAVSFGFKITPEVTASLTGTIPATGNDSSTPALLGATMMICGIALVSRRRMNSGTC